MGASFILPAIGAAANFINQRNANQRYQGVESEALANQANFRNQANSNVQQETNNIASSSPKALANAEVANAVNTLRKNVGGSTGTSSTSPTNFGAPTSATAPVAGASKRYGADTASSGQEVQSYGNTNAANMSAIDSAVNQRKNEALSMQTLQANNDVLNARASLQGFTDQLRARAAGTANPWVSLFANAMGNAGQYFAMNKGSSADTPTYVGQYSGQGSGGNVTSG